MTDDLIARAKAAQSVWNRSHTVEIDIVYGPNAVADAYYAAPEIVDGLLAEVERLRDGLDSVKRFARKQALSDRVRSYPNRSSLHNEERYWLDVLALVEAVLRGDQ